MAQIAVGIRELKARLSYYLRQVKAGVILVITEHDRPIGRIVPVNLGIAERLEALVDAGLIAWSGKTLPAIPPLAKTRGSQTVADLLLEDRE